MNDYNPKPTQIVASDGLRIRLIRQSSWVAVGYVRNASSYPFAEQYSKSIVKDGETGTLRIVPTQHNPEMKMWAVQWDFMPSVTEYNYCCAVNIFDEDELDTRYPGIFVRPDKTQYLSNDFALADSN